MAATNNKTGIANLALINLGQPTVNNVDDPGISFAAATIAQLFDDARQFTLRAGPWRFALERRELAEDPTVPTFTWARRFLIPPECMLLHQVGEDDYPLEVNKDYKIEKGYILTSAEAPLPIVFVDDVSDISTFPADFKFALAAYLAHLAAPPVLQSTDKAAQMMELFNGYMDQAANNNALENAPRIVKKSKWISSQRQLRVVR